MNPQELINAMRNLMLQLNDEHKSTKTALKAHADAIKLTTDTAATNLHGITDQVHDRLQQLEDLLSTP